MFTGVQNDGESSRDGFSPKLCLSRCEWPFLSGTVALESFLVAGWQNDAARMISTIPSQVCEKNER